MGRGHSYLGIMGRRRVTPRWADDPAQRQEGEDNEGNGKLEVSRRGRGRLVRVHNNKQRILGPEWSMSEVETPPPNNSDKPHGLVESINNSTVRFYFSGKLTNGNIFINTTLWF